MKQISLGILCLGFALFAAGALWGKLSTGTSKWTNEKAVRSADIKAKMAYLGGIINGQGSRRTPAEIEKAKTEFDALTAENDQLNSEFILPPARPRQFRKSCGGPDS